MDGKSLDITAQKIKELQELFPDVFTEGKIDFDRLRAALGEDVFAKGEHYELSWAGKTEARKEVQKQTTATLIPDHEGSVDFNNAQNIFIEGENLEVLKVLQKSYFGKVKMIYIDPPYNTGNDSFVYPDDYTERREEYNKRTGITDDEGYLNKQDLWRKNSKESGQFHSVWLSMMYPRLYLARNLMREDGVVFVSIDDNEQANLKLLMDDVFGEENFICDFVREAIKGGSQSKHVRQTHDYILVYAKSKGNLVFTGFDKDELELNLEDEKGAYTKGRELNKWGAGSRREDSPSMWFPIKGPNGEEVYPIRNDGSEGRWRLGKVKMKKLVEENEIIFERRDNGTYIAYEKLRGNKTQHTQFISILKDKYLNAKATEDLKSLFKTERVIFDFSKPEHLIRDLLILANTDDDDIVLDFFGGSASTAHATLELNEIDDGKRKFIIVQMPELLDEKSEAKKAGYHTIAEISKARMKKVIEKIQKERENKLDFDGNDKQFLGFKSYKLGPSNFNIWRNDVVGEKALIEQLQIFTQAEKKDSARENMLHELILKAGRQLTSNIEKIAAKEATIYNVNENELHIFFDVLSGEIIANILALKPKKVICLNSCFSDNQDLTNFKLQLKDAGIELTII